MIAPRPLKPPRSPLASLPGWERAEQTYFAEQHNKAVLSNIEEREQWWDTFIGTEITFQVGDDFRALSTDHAADLANAGLADELRGSA